MNLYYRISKTMILKIAFIVSMTLFTGGVWLFSAGLLTYPIIKLPIFFALFVASFLILRRTTDRTDFFRSFLIGAVLTAGIIASNIYVWKAYGVVGDNSAAKYYFSGIPLNILFVAVFLSILLYVYFDKIAEKIKSLV